jgi:membrane-bound acyltransferase YfiQ involved in biofilm formation
MDLHRLRKSSTSKNFSYRKWVQSASHLSHLLFRIAESKFMFGRVSMSFGIYAVGYLILIAGVAYLAHLMHIPQHYIVAIAVIMLGVGIVTNVQTTRHKDPS